MCILLYYFIVCVLLLGRNKEYISRN